MQALLTSGLLLLLIACNGPRAREDHAAAADLLTREHETRAVKASVAGSDCRVLLIGIEDGRENDLVESIHYGTGDYGAFGGVEEFAQERGFRAVVYRDRNGGVWTYGATTKDEARSMPRCR